MYTAVLGIGGTETIVAILDENDGILIQESFPSIVKKCETHLELCIRAIRRLMHRTELQAEDFAELGVSLPGVVDNEKGILLYAPYANWRSVKVTGYLNKNLGILRVRCENDVNACAIGEKRFGLENNYMDFIWMAVNTGVDGIMMEGSKLARGGLDFADGPRHLRVEYKSPAHYSCGQYGCLEARGSGIVLIRETRKRRLTSPAFAKTLGEIRLKPDGVGCTALARAGNTDALDILNQIGTYLGRGTSYCINILNTQTVVISGGVAASLDLLLPSIHVSVQQNAFKQMQDINIVEAPLGYEAALLGAAALVLEQREHKHSMRQEERTDMKRLKAAVIGLELIGAAHVETLKRVPGVGVMALVDIIGPIQKTEELDVPNGFSDYREMIEVVESDCIHTCASNHTHKEIALYAFKHRIHVICEKSMTRNAGEAEKMLEAAKKSNPIHTINLHNRFYPTNHQLRNVILDGALGKIYSVHGVYLQDYFSKESDFSWRMLSDRSGSTRATSDIDSHQIDLVRYVTGSRAKEVFTELQANLPVRKMNLAEGLKNVAVDTEDVSYVMVRFENGAVGSAAFSQVYQGRKNQTTIRVSGSEIPTEWDNEAVDDLKLRYRNEPNHLLTKDRGLARPDTAPIITYPGGHAEGFPDTSKQSFIAVYGAIRGVEPIDPHADFKDGLRQMRALGKILESAKTDC